MTINRLTDMKSIGLLTKSYILALSFIALLVISSQVLVHQFLAESAMDSIVINIAGRQRMLSQKISKAALEATRQEAVNEQALAELRSSVELWQRSHEGLINGDTEWGLPGDNSEQISAQFQELEPMFQVIKNAALTILAQPTQHPSTSSATEDILAQEAAYLVLMNDIVNSYEQEAVQRVQYLRKIEYSLLGTTLILLLCEGLFLFRPIAKRLNLELLSREKREQKIREKNRQLAISEEAAQRSEELLSEIISTIPFFVYWKDSDLKFKGANEAFLKIAGFESVEQLSGKTDQDLSWDSDEAIRNQQEDQIVLDSNEALMHVQKTYHNGDAETLYITTSKLPLHDSSGNSIGVVGVMIDLTQQKMMEDKLKHANKLESIGQLAAGIAHEINTPLQYINDNTLFLEDGFEELGPVLTSAQKAISKLRNLASDSPFTDELKEVTDDIDIEYLQEEIPAAIKQSLNGIERVRKIVLSMKDFSHPGSDGISREHINNLVESTVTVASNEWKYVAEVDLQLDPELGTVPCFPSELNQVFLSIIVNAAHAINEKHGEDTERKGQITIRSRVHGKWAEVRISDTGGGIPPEVQQKIFDPFFTTKDVGKGTGQGLSIAYRIVVDTHKGNLDFETEEGVGTTFIIQIPLEVKTDDMSVEIA